MGGILVVLCRRDGRGNAIFRVLCASRLISVGGDCGPYNLVLIAPREPR
jgi:hypothetical protein